MRPFTILPLALLLPGCVASVVGNVVTAPIKVVSKTADVMTTSQSEADEKRGRALRKREERLGKLERDYRRHNEQCSNGDQDACRRAQAEYGEIQELMATVPVERD